MYTAYRCVLGRSLRVASSVRGGIRDLIRSGKDGGQREMMCFVLDSFCRFSLSLLFFPLLFKIGFGGHAMDSRIRRIRVRRCAMTGNGANPPNRRSPLPCNVPPRPGNRSFWTPRELSHVGFAQRCDHAIPYLLTKGTPVVPSWG